MNAIKELNNILEGNYENASLFLQGMYYRK